MLRVKKKDKGKTPEMNNANASYGKRSLLNCMHELVGMG